MTGSFPSPLQHADRWSPWSLVERDGRKCKVPAIPKDKPWRSLAQAESMARNTNATGLGFQLGDGWVGVDLDRCRDAVTGLVLPEAAAMVAKFTGAYVSASVSGMGIHVIGRGPAGITGVEVVFRDAPQVIRHDGSWWFAMLRGNFGNPMCDISAPLLELRGAKKPTEAPPPGALRGFPRAKSLSDDALLTEILNSGQAVLFAHLFRGEWRELGRYQSQSEADLALVQVLTWWTDYDLERVDRLFRQSGLMRPKWERADYRERALRKAGC